jgi:hypothetical protein
VTGAAILQAGVHQMISRISRLEHCEVVLLLLQRLQCGVKHPGFLVPGLKMVKWFLVLARHWRGGQAEIRRNASFDLFGLPFLYIEQR